MTNRLQGRRSRYDGWSVTGWYAYCHECKTEHQYKTKSVAVSAAVIHGKVNHEDNGAVVSVGQKVYIKPKQKG